MTDNIARLALYGSQDWRRRVPRLANGDADGAKAGLATAENTFIAIEKLRADMAAELAVARERFTKKALPVELRKIAAAYSDKLATFGKYTTPLQRHADGLLAKLKPQRRDDGMDGAERAVREGEIRRLLLEQLPAEAGLTIEGNDGTTRWIVQQYDVALEAEDWLLVDAIENAPSIFPDTVRLTSDELANARLRRAEAAMPETARELADYRAALADLTEAATLVESDVADVLRANADPRTVPDPIAELASGKSTA